MIIIDSSVAFKWFSTDEIYTKEAMRILENHLSKLNSIFVPDLIFYEMTNAWSTKSTLRIDKIKVNIKQLKKYNLNVIPFSLVLLEKITSFSKEHKVTVYDAIYAVLAKEKKCPLITADEKFVAAVKLPFVKNLKDS